MTPKPTPTAMRLPLACFTSVVRSSTAAKSAFFQRRSVFLTLAKRPFFFGSASRASSVSAGVSLSDCSSGFAPFSASVEGARSSTKLQDPPKFRFPALPRPSRLCPPGRRYPFFLPTFVPLPRGLPPAGRRGLFLFRLRKDFYFCSFAYTFFPVS